MPIHTMQNRDGVFFAKQVGYVDRVDARMWANALQTYATASDFPIVALVDMSEVDRLCPTTIKIFSNVLAAYNVQGVMLVAGDHLVSRNANVINKLAEIPGLRIFPNLRDALHFAQSRLQPNFGAYTTYSIAAAGLAF